VASVPLPSSVCSFPFTFQFQQQDGKKTKPNKKTGKESWKGNLSMALTVMHYAPGRNKAHPKELQP